MIWRGLTRLCVKLDRMKSELVQNISHEAAHATQFVKG